MKNINSRIRCKICGEKTDTIWIVFGADGKSYSACNDCKILWDKLEPERMKIREQYKLQQPG